MELHKLLQKQLKKLGLNNTSFPDNTEKWKMFLAKVNLTYIECDQERYLNERSIEISSNELLNLNQKLENAQHLAQLGYWMYDKSTEKITLSRELFNLLGLHSTNSTLDFEYFIQLVHAEDSSNFFNSIKKSLSTEAPVEMDIRIQAPDKKYCWFYILSHSVYKNSQLMPQLLGIAMNITARKLAELEISTLNQQLIIAARQAGIAEIAISILHNVGNILNSANVSLGILQESINQTHFKKLTTILDLLKTHENQIINYLTEDSKGQLVPRYLIAISEALKIDITTIYQEIKNLTTNLHHIREIVAMQQNYATRFEKPEKIFLPEVVDAALQMSGYLTFHKNIEVKKIYSKTPFLITDKSKLLQILVNLIRNAKEAVIANKEKIHKKISLSIKANPPNQEFIIIVKDNGIGITKENLIKVFSFGFTGKPNGHGIGLHASALSAKEIGGHLRAESKGPDLGATFTLTLPANMPQRENSNETKK